VNSASSFQRLIESFSGRYETVVKRHTWMITIGVTIEH
jgi:hypothetical protein